MFPLETAELTTFYVSRSPAEQHFLGESQTLQRTMAGGGGQWRKATRVIPWKGRGKAERASGQNSHQSTDCDADSVQHVQRAHDSEQKYE